MSMWMTDAKIGKEGRERESNEATTVNECVCVIGDWQWILSMMSYQQTPVGGKKQTEITWHQRRQLHDSLFNTVKSVSPGHSSNPLTSEVGTYFVQNLPSSPYICDYIKLFLSHLRHSSFLHQKVALSVDQESVTAHFYLKKIKMIYKIKRKMKN